MIRAIAETWGQIPMPAWPEAEGRSRHRRRRPAPVVTRELVSIGAEAAEMAAFEAVRTFDAIEDEVHEDEFDVTVAEVAHLLATLPNVSVRTQARMGVGTVRRLIAVNAMNRL